MWDILPTTSGRIYLEIVLEYAFGGVGLQIITYLHVIYRRYTLCILSGHSFSNLGGIDQIGGTLFNLDWNFNASSNINRDSFTCFLVDI